MLSKRKIDHLVYAVPDLEWAMDQIEQLFGVRPLFGGYHTTQGTQNALLHLGNDCYLEILTIDEENKNIKAPRWMGIDEIDSPQITRWALQSADLKKDSTIVKDYNAQMGNIQGGQRKTTEGDLLSWELVMPLANPMIEIIPFMIDWQNTTVHPSQNLPEVCQLMDLEFTHPEPETLAPVLEQLSLDLKIIKGEQIAIRAKIKTPKGMVWI